MSALDDIDLDALVAGVALHCGGDGDRLERSAAGAAALLRPFGADGPDMLLGILARPPALPLERAGGLSEDDWRDACGVAVVAILAECGSDGVEALFGI